MKPAPKKKRAAKPKMPTHGRTARMLALGILILVLVLAAQTFPRP